MKYAAIYIRVSTDAQREEGYSIEAQTEMLEAYCVSKGIKNYKFYTDGGFSGSNIDRPAMQEMISDIKSGKISHVIVYKLDRLSRSQKDTLYLIEDVFNPNGVSFVSMNESMDTSTPLGRLMLGILSAFAQLERENIKERTRMGMKERVKSGLWYGGGRIPFGYDYDSARGILVPNKDAELVKKAYELYLDGYSTAKIANILGLKYERLALQILKRKSNAGYITYNGEEYQGQHEPIISPEIYEKTMQMMRERSKNRTSENGHLLSGLLYCGKCGAKMRYQKWGKSGYKIVCYSQDKSKPYLVRDPDCTNGRMWSDDLEDIIKGDLFSFNLKRKKVKQTKTKSLGEILESQQKTAKERLKRLYNLYSESADEVLISAIEEARDELSKISEQIKEHEKRQKDTALKKEAVKMLSNLSDVWEHLSTKDKIRIVRSCISKIVITDDNVEIYYKFEE